MTESLVRAFENSVSLACCLCSLRGGHSSWLSKAEAEVEGLCWTDSRSVMSRVR